MNFVSLPVWDCNLLHEVCQIKQKDIISALQNGKKPYSVLQHAVTKEYMFLLYSTREHYLVYLNPEGTLIQDIQCVFDGSPSEEKFLEAFQAIVGNNTFKNSSWFPILYDSSLDDLAQRVYSYVMIYTS